MNSFRNTLNHHLLQPNSIFLLSAAEHTLSQSSSSSNLSLRSYSKAPTPASNRKKKLSPSFKPGPFKGALLDQNTLQPELNQAPSPPQNQNQNQTQEPPINIKHDYSVSQLAKSFKANSNRSNSKLHFPHSDIIQDHLRDLLYPLTFSDQIACRIVSSKNLVKSQDSLDAIRAGTPGGIGFASLGEHNCKFSFIGRRMMHFALSNFILHAPTIERRNKKTMTNKSEKLMSEVIEEALLTKFVLGQYVGHRWELEKIMRWKELAPPSPDHPDPLELKFKTPLSTGLWTARGHVVEAILGAIMVQYGTRLSNAVFNSLVLPHLSFRLDRSYMPAIKAIQAHDRELENPKAGLVDWNQLDIEPFSTGDNNHLDLGHQLEGSSSRSPLPIAAVG